MGRLQVLRIIVKPRFVLLNHSGCSLRISTEQLRLALDKGSVHGEVGSSSADSQSLLLPNSGMALVGAWTVAARTHLGGDAVSAANYGGSVYDAKAPGAFCPVIRVALVSLHSDSGLQTGAPDFTVRWSFPVAFTCSSTSIMAANKKNGTTNSATGTRKLRVPVIAPDGRGTRLLKAAVFRHRGSMYCAFSREESPPVLLVSCLAV